MKKYSIIVIVSLFMYNCSTSKGRSIDASCQENEAFRKEFFRNIDSVEKLMSNQNQTFRKSLQFISRYTQVSWKDMANYANLYPYGTFDRDKKVWLEWYQVNKCSNLKIR